MPFPTSIAADPAFDVFYRETVSVTGTRLETGAAAARELRLTIPRACVVEGELADLPANAGAPAGQRMYTVMIRAGDWPDHLTPRRGDSVTSRDYPAMRVADVLFDAGEWRLTCITTGSET